MLTKKQKLFLDYITKFIEKNGYAPSFEEIKSHFKLASKSTVHQHINGLISKGFLSKEHYKARSIELSQNKPKNTVDIPLLGTIAAGEPIEAIETAETITVSTSQIAKTGEHFALRVTGNSMVGEGIFDNDIVIIKKQETAENGETVVALLNGDEVTLKKIYKEKNGFRLQPANSTLKPIFAKDVMVRGKVVSVLRNLEQQKKEYFYEEIVKESNKQDIEELKNKIICGDAVAVLKKIPSQTIDIVITSPPYDEIRTYNGHNKFDLRATGREIFRVLKDGGIAAMVIQDQTKNFGKTLTSFRTILDWCDNIGFKLFECLIYRKYGAEGAWWNKRFRVDHEYIPVFLKGERPQYFNKEQLKIPSKHGGKTMTGGGTRLTNGIRIPTRSITINPMKCRGTIWEYLTAGDGSRLKHLHPATFPNQLPYDFITCFCPENGIVLDPFIGSGTTAVAAKNLKRQYIGIDICQDYCDIAEKRLAEEVKNTLF